MTPPPSAKTMMGTMRKSPSMPSASGDPLSKYSCQTTATCCICEPVSEMAWPARSRRKSRERSAMKRAAGGDGGGACCAGAAGSVIDGGYRGAHAALGQKSTEVQLPGLGDQVVPAPAHVA